VIEARVLGLNHFLQQALTMPQYACPELVDFLEREKNAPPPGLDLVLELHETPDAAAGPDGSAEGARQAQLKRLVESASQAFIPVSHEAPVLDAAYLHERAASYAATLRPSDGPIAGTDISLAQASTPAPPPAAHSVEAAIERLLHAAATSQDAADAALARATTEAVGGAIGGLAVQGKHEVLVTVG
jgi:hypothetical protein